MLNKGILVFLCILVFVSCDNACNNPQDLKLFNRTSPSIHDLMSECGHKCLSKEGCLDTCYESDGFTNACAACLGEMSECVVKKCFWSCSTEPKGKKCAECCNEKCTPAYMKCSGVVIPPYSD